VDHDERLRRPREGDVELAQTSPLARLVDLRRLDDHHVVEVEPFTYRRLATTGLRARLSSLSRGAATPGFSVIGRSSRSPRRVRDIPTPEGRFPQGRTPSIASVAKNDCSTESSPTPRKTPRDEVAEETSVFEPSQALAKRAV